MKGFNRALYERIIRNISKEIKNVLNEDIQNFTPSEYSDDELDLVDRNAIRNITITTADKNIFNYHFRPAILNFINCNFEKANELLKYDECTLGELFKDALVKAMTLDPDELQDVHDKFNEWLSVSYPTRNKSHIKQFMNTYMERYGLDKEDIEKGWKDAKAMHIDDILNNIKYFIDGYSIPQRIEYILTNKVGDNPTFREWVEEWIEL